MIVKLVWHEAYAFGIGKRPSKEMRGRNFDVKETVTPDLKYSMRQTALWQRMHCKNVAEVWAFERGVYDEGENEWVFEGSKRMRY